MFGGDVELKGLVFAPMYTPVCAKIPPLPPQELERDQRTVTGLLSRTGSQGGGERGGVHPLREHSFGGRRLSKGMLPPPVTSDRTPDLMIPDKARSHIRYRRWPNIELSLNFQA